LPLPKWALVGALAVLSASTMPFVSPSALYTDSAPSTNNVFTTAACFRAEFGTVQRGTATSSANGTTTVTITAVDPTKSFLLFSTRSSSNRPVGSVLRGRLASATTLEFIRVTDESPVSTITIEWSVVEYTCGISVQRGDTNVAATTVDVSITPVAARSHAFVTWSKSAASADASWDSNDTLVVDLTSTSNVELRTAGANASHTVSWQLVEFLNGADVNVQRGSASLTGTNLSTTATLASAVTTSHAFVLADLQSAGSGTDIGARLIRAQLTNSTTVTFDRSISGSPDDLTEIGWQVVELTDGSAVQRGSVAFASAAAQVDATVNLIDTSRATAFASTEVGGGQAAGRTSYAADDTVGVASATVKVLDNSTVRLDRANTAAAADVAWTVVEWGSPTPMKSVQQGTATSAANGTLTVPISSVDPTKAYLVFSTRHNLNRPVGAAIRGRIASATTLEFVRVTNESPVSSIAIQWYVVEYKRGVQVQRGETAVSATSVDIPITPVGALRQAFVTFSKTPAAADSSWESDDAVVADLTSTSNLELRADVANASHIVSWQVVEFLSVSAADVQRGSTSLTSTTLSQAATLGTAVNTSHTFVLASVRTTGLGVDIGARLVRAQLTNSTTITIDRSASGSPDDVTEVAWQSIELKDGSSVQRGSAAFGSGAATVTPVLTAVDTSRTIALGSFQHGGGQNMGRTPYVADDVLGVASATLAITSATELTLTRANTAAAADIAWFVIQFPDREP
jgi:hypothetical protein